MQSKSDLQGGMRVNLRTWYGVVMRTVEPDAGETRRRGAQTDQRYDPILTDT